MRRWRLVFPAVILLMTSAIAQKKAVVSRVAYLTYDAGVDGTCSVSVTAAPEVTNGPPSQILTVSCQGKQILRYATSDALVDLFLNYPHVDRVMARWEGGSHVRFTVFRVDAHQLKAGTVFDEQLEGAPDVVNVPDVLLVQRGKRWPNGQAASLPTSTDVYQWAGEKYLLDKRWGWSEAMRYEDRFCVLDTAHLSCPVTRLPLQ